MANIMTVRQFQKEYRWMEPGTQVVIVDGSRKKILASIQVLDKPETIEKVIKQIFTR